MSDLSRFVVSSCTGSAITRPYARHHPCDCYGNGY